MNIGETDADGWTYVRFGDAAKAAQDGTHDCETKHVAADGDEWKICYSFSSNQYTLYRIREKTRTVTVTIPRPYSPSFSHNSNLIGLSYQSFSDAQTAYKTICAAMGQS